MTTRGIRIRFLGKTIPRRWEASMKNHKGQVLTCPVVHDPFETEVEEQAYSIAMVHLANAFLTLEAMESADILTPEEL